MQLELHLLDPRFKVWDSDPSDAISIKDWQICFKRMHKMHRDVYNMMQLVFV